MKIKITALISALILIFTLTACGSGSAGQTAQTLPETSSAKADNSETEMPAEALKTNEGKTLVVYFSATGTTKGVAEKIADITNADIYEIKASKEYTSADLDWHDRNSRTTIEQNDKSARPEIASEKLSLEGYSTVFIGYPIWWGEEPRIMDSFVEKYNFDSITMIPFCTSSSSGIGRSGENLKENAKSGNWTEGRRFGGGASESELQSWIDSLN